jgi:hypothetical protein
LEIIKKRKTGDKDLSSGMPRNYEIYDPLDFLAEVTQHIPNKGEHQIRFYGWYSNKKRGLNRKSGIAAISAQAESDTAFRRKCRMTWAALIKLVYEVDPLKCPKPVVSLPNHAMAKSALSRLSRKKRLSKKFSVTAISGKTINRVLLRLLRCF